MVVAMMHCKELWFVNVSIVVDFDKSSSGSARSEFAQLMLLLTR